MTAVYIAGSKFTLAPAALLGQGGEAEVYDLGGDRVVKWWKPATHADFDGMPDAQAAAQKRIADAPAKLRALPTNLPASVAVPVELAYANKSGGDVVGYVMKKVAGTPLHSYGELKWRRDHPVAGADVVAALLSLHDAISALHRANVVVGDCNDLNVLVDGRTVHLIDVDSYQFGGYACSMFSERFVDPRLCDAQLVPQKPHTTDSDWFAFAVMAFRSLLGVHPWGGVHAKCLGAARAARRLSVMGADITYPRAARPLAILPDELLGVFRQIFEHDVRGAFPREQLERLRLRACRSCGEEHARVACPACQTRAHVPPVVVHGRLKWQPMARAAFGSQEVLHSLPAAGAVHAVATPCVWIAGDALMRSSLLGPQRIGSVLAGQTCAWVGSKLGVGFYRAGGYAVGFTFRPDRGSLDDRVKLPKLRGQLVDAHAILGDDRAWLFLTLADAGKLATTCVVIGADTQVLASETLVDHPWLAGASGACAGGSHLFVPTDDGIARIEIAQGAIVQTRLFSETSPLVGAGDQLSLIPGGIAVARRRDAVLLQLA